MTSLTLALDNIDVGDNTEQISKLFPKCRPRSDINLNPIIASGRDHACIDNTTNTVMNLDSENDRWLADSSCDVSRDNITQLNSADEDDIVEQHKHTASTYKLCDSRIIEIAGGREIYSQSRSKALRKSRSLLSANEDGEKKPQKSPMRQGVWELRTHGDPKKLRNSRDYTETAFSSEVCSVVHEQNEESDVGKTSPISMTFPGEEVVVFDDIGETWNLIEPKPAEPERIDKFNSSDSKGDKVTKVIGSLPIAVYEGSPRRYGQRHTETNCSHPQLPSAQSLLSSPSVYPPRPGFPQRVVSSPDSVEATPEGNAENNINCSLTANPTTTSSTFDYLYEFSETRKVLEEFFKCPPPEEDNRLEEEFQDLEYELRRQTSESGNSYVGQRLAKNLPEENEFCTRIDSPKKCFNVPTIQDHDMEHENNFLDLSIGTGSSGDLGETEVGLQVGHSRNFTFSPETTDCDSNCGDLDSEVSLMLMENTMGPSAGLLGSNTDLMGPTDSLRLYSSMPVLEDGLSSGHASDTDNNNPTVILMKRQITEIEREINQGICKSNQSKSSDSCLSPKTEVCGTSSLDLNGCISSFEEPMTISQIELLEKTPPPPAPAPHRLLPGEKPNNVEAAIKDIRLTLQRTKTLPLQRHPEEECDENATSPIWVPSHFRQRGISTTSAESERKATNSGNEEEENDTDLETDRLLGQQRTDDQGFYDDKGWRKPKTRTILPQISLSTSKTVHNSMDEDTLPLVPPTPKHLIPPPPRQSPRKVSLRSVRKDPYHRISRKRCGLSACR
nr:unnamed protein product [Callosobruchus analis]